MSVLSLKIQNNPTEQTRQERGQGQVGQNCGLGRELGLAHCSQFPSFRLEHPAWVSGVHVSITRPRGTDSLLNADPVPSPSVFPSILHSLLSHLRQEDRAQGHRALVGGPDLLTPQVGTPEDTYWVNK